MPRAPTPRKQVDFAPSALTGGNYGARPTRRRAAADDKTIERLTLGAGLGFVLVNVVVFCFFMPAHDLHVHHEVKPPKRASSPPPSPPRASAGAAKPVRAPVPRPSSVKSGPTQGPRPVGPANAPPPLKDFYPHGVDSLAADDAGANAAGGFAVDEEVSVSAPSMMGRWLAQCAVAPRCSCLMHGLGPSSEALFAAFPTVAFFVLATGPSAQQLASRLSRAGHSHVYVLRTDLTTKGVAPLNNDVLNPTRAKLTALHALRVSNEFFDLQIIHSNAPSWLVDPSVEDARAILSLSAWTLVLLPDSDASARAWRRAAATKAAAVVLDADVAAGDGAVAAAAAAPAAPAIDGDAVAATSRVTAVVAASGCVDNAAAETAGSVVAATMANRCEGGPIELPALRDPTAATALLLELTTLRRLNAHHYSCWHSPRCHQRMYVMDLARDESAPAGDAAGLARAADGGDEIRLRASHEIAQRARQLLRRGWVRRIPRLYRVDDGTRFGAHNFSTLDEGWALRKKDLGFDTGGMNLDTAIGLQLAVGARARLAQQFLALPVGRDMMLWNIIVGRLGLYAIDQEGHAFEDGAVPWSQRVWPYCISVRDCYEKALAALCGRQRPSQPLEECFAALTQAQLCPDAARPYPCPNGCQPSFLDCKGRGSKAASFVGRKA